MRETKICKNREERNNLIQDLKIQLNLSIDKDKIAKGHININTFIIIYLREYESIRFINPKEISAFINPSKVKRLKPSELLIRFKLSSNVAKQMLLLNKVSPKFLIAREIEDDKNTKP